MHLLELKTSRLRLVLPASSDAARALEYFVTNREHLQPTNPHLPRDFFSLSFWEKRLTRSLQEFEQDQSLRLFIERDARFVGVVNFTQIARGPFQACYLGYSLAREEEGQGFMAEALRAAIQYVFDERHIHRIMANYLPENKRSANVLRRLGFLQDGSSPDYLYICGAWREHILTSLTNPRWTPRIEDLELFEL